MDQKPNKHKYTNHLIHESSPYLLQHAHNPVEWYAWNDESFALAKKLNKAVFLSIGYSTCHWCHVMEHESFENEKLAALMNDVFINIKVDREERPDIDNIYMNVCQMMTGNGGWPLTIIMTPDKKPFFAATYIPKEDRYGRAGMFSLINHVADIWENKKGDVFKSADEITRVLINQQQNKQTAKFDQNNFNSAFEQLKSSYDETYGGFGKKPKFPSPHQLLFLLRYWQAKDDETALNMVAHTLKQMRLGGIYDQLGFGFHRYSTDINWKVPHFEKMLYDQAMLTLAYLEAFQATKNPMFSQTVEEILEYVSRELTSPDGGFYTAEDADSEGEEGTFYVWAEKELKSILSEKEFKLVTNYFNIVPEGNFLEESTGKLTGKNILFCKSDKFIKKESKEDADKFEEIEKIRIKLFNIREKREHPFKDDKVLTDWNGLMLAAFAQAGKILNKEEYVVIAKKNIRFVHNNLVDESGNLLHSFRAGKADIKGNLDDYAFYIFGLLETYESTFKIEYLKQAIQHTDKLIDQFYDKNTAELFFSPKNGEKLIARSKDLYDGAIPSGFSIAVYNFLKISKLTGDTKWANLSHEIIENVAYNVNRYPSGLTMLLGAMQFTSEQSMEIVIVGEENDKRTDEFLELIRQQYLPNAVIILKTRLNGNYLSEIAEYTQNYEKVDGKPTVYVCRNYQCHQPVTQLKNLQVFFEEGSNFMK